MLGQRSSGPFNPSKIRGGEMLGWLRADLGITQSGGTVSNWANQKGIQGDAAQSTAAKQPIYVPARQNGKPCLNFDGNRAMTWPIVPPGLSTGLQSVFIVAALGTAVSNLYAILSMKAPTGVDFSDYSFELGQAGYTNVLLVPHAGSSGVSFGYNATLGQTPHCVIATYNGAAAATGIDSTFDGAQQITVQGGGWGRIGSDLGSIGARLSSTQVLAIPFIGDIYEIAAWQTILNKVEMARLWSYAQNRYKII